MTDAATKMSDAIRAGCKIRPRQCFYKNEDGPDSACALTAALLGFGDKHYTTWGVPESIIEKVQWWNDREKLTREQIADKLEAMGY